MLAHAHANIYVYIYRCSSRRQPGPSTACVQTARAFDGVGVYTFYYTCMAAAFPVLAHTSGTMRFIMKHTLIAISHSAIMSSEGLIIALLGTISFRTRFQEIISRKPHIRRCLQSIETLTRHPPSNMRMSKHHSNREILEIWSPTISFYYWAQLWAPLSS